MFTGRIPESDQRVRFGPVGDGGGWKLDVISASGEPLSDPYSDAWEATFDEILPYLIRYASEDVLWTDDLGGRVSFWTVVTSHRIAAGAGV